MDHDQPSCEARGTGCEMPHAPAPVRPAIQPAVPVSSDANAVPRIFLASASRQVRRLRVGKDGIFPW
jgi:hypothetical protein